MLQITSTSTCARDVRLDRTELPKMLVGGRRLVELVTSPTKLKNEVRDIEDPPYQSCFPRESSLSVFGYAIP